MWKSSIEWLKCHIQDVVHIGKKIWIICKWTKYDFLPYNSHNTNLSRADRGARSKECITLLIQVGCQITHGSLTKVIACSNASRKNPISSPAEDRNHPLTRILEPRMYAEKDNGRRWKWGEITLFSYFVLEFQLQHGGRLIIPLTALPVKKILLNIGYDHLILFLFLNRCPPPFLLVIISSSFSIWDILYFPTV